MGKKAKKRTDKFDQQPFEIIRAKKKKAKKAEFGEILKKK